MNRPRYYFKINEQEKKTIASAKKVEIKNHWHIYIGKMSRTTIIIYQMFIKPAKKNFHKIY